MLSFSTRVNSDTPCVLHILVHILSWATGGRVARELALGSTRTFLSHLRPVSIAGPDEGQTALDQPVVIRLCLTDGMCHNPDFQTPLWCFRIANKYSSSEKKRKQKM
ncbi:hypothetical protein PoB_006906500 [Plakobranchus ocellatus]|uniref:Secreted protein n=1 Tax=Plakobranchus ocellatus TaxID=259542 RepID=A0AAV4DF07_9GAST|nr:hypothetical protein PoB_006906500 [Plakobranchus ocellatus]